MAYEKKLSGPIDKTAQEIKQIEEMFRKADQAYGGFADAEPASLGGPELNTRIVTKQKSLSPREIDAMTLLGLGYSRAQVAEELSISEHTLRKYIETARFKLGAANTTHSVVLAQKKGLIVV